MNIFNNHYNTLNDRNMLKANCTGKAPSKAAIG